MTTGGKKAQRRIAAKKAAELKRKRRRNRIVVGVAIVVVGLIAFAVTRPEPEELAAVETFPDLGGGHLNIGDPLPEYNSSPATSGPHDPSAAACGIYTEELPDVTLVHNLEHGTIVIQYQPDLAEDDRAPIEEFARSKPSHVLVAPRADLSDPVVITAWTRMLRLDGFDPASFAAFFDRWVRRGPEVGVPCPFGIDQST